jgi:hypothetical protein
MSWCYHPEAQFFAGKFNDDDVTDFLCHDTSNGYKWQAFQ